MKLFFWIFLMFGIVSIVSAKFVNSTDIKCIANYLKRNNLLDVTVKSGHFIGNVEKCEQRIMQAKQQFQRDIRRKINSHEFKELNNMSLTSECPIETIDQYNVTDVLLRKIMFQHFNRHQNKRKLNDLQEIQQRYYIVAKIICNNQHIYAPKINDKFQKLLEKKVDINDIYEFNEIKHCIKKQIVENGVIDVANVNISARIVPLEDLQELDCKEVVDDLYNTMFRDVEETVTNEDKGLTFIPTSCVVRKAKKFRFIEKMFSFVFLIHSPELSENERNNLRATAAEMEPSVLKYMFACTNVYK